MKKNLLTIAILIIAVAIIVVNIWKPSDVESEKKISSEKEANTKEVSEIEQQSSLEVGAKAPDFELKTLDGQQVKLTDFRGKKVILNFWATWCPPCKAEMPHMQNFYLKNQNKDVTLLAVNLTSSDKGLDVVDEFVKDYQLTFPILLDTEGVVGNMYKVYSIPTSYILDSKGIITQKIVGPMDEDRMNQLITSIK
ncbi:MULTISPECIES: peroxiredoxin family protein [Bacillus]|uniref:peroxiredoxin family protein n=1 Tax=Bacillus TaxID=1386 RepID=UPI0002EC0359|nr:MULTISPECIES: TlpA disulfide reductase family protein [Bacillus]